MNVAFAGLTAAGKTTHAMLLSQELGYTYVSATRLLLDIVGAKAVDSEGVWLTGGIELQRALTSDWAADALMNQLQSLAETSSTCVFDTWALPWYFSGPMIRIYIRSDRFSRGLKCQVSHDDAMPSWMDLAGAVSFVDQKDLATRSVFQRLYGFDVFEPGPEFDAVLDNSFLISEASRSAADSGIAAFRSVVSTVVGSRLSAGELGEAELESLGPWRGCISSIDGIHRP